MTEDTLRFGFGRNWAEFVDKHLSDKVIEASMAHLRQVLKRDTLNGLRILDIGCGSGVHSLAMMRLGADEVVAFDYDADSVLTAERVRAWAGLNTGWRIEQGSVLDEAYLERLGTFDLVYSWGVLHHTGDMWRAVKLAATRVAPGGEFYIALYSADTYVDPSPEEWMRIKKAYNAASPMRKKLMELHHQLVHIILPQLKAGRSVLQAIRDYGSRGMSIWTDTKDWLGGWPMEFARLAETRDRVAKDAGLEMVHVLNGEGCTEYVFADPAKNAHWAGVNARRQLVGLSGPFLHSGGYGFMAKLPELADRADDGAHPKRSTLMLYEDGKPLGLAHAIHDVIRNRGQGRFSHWQDWLVFSASDNTDPNLNGHTYTYCVDY
jgi:2-polyprenyl-3-methyl-5-hydroxy-6-metoxy-1,4-benzoquinol methylase